MGISLRPERAPSDATRTPEIVQRQPDVAEEAVQMFRAARQAGATKEQMDWLVRHWSNEIGKVNDAESAAIPERPMVTAIGEALQTPAAGVPGGRLAMSGARALTDPSKPFAEHQGDINAETSDIPVASFLGRMTGGFASGAPLARMGGITGGAAYGAADQFLHNDPDMGTSLAGRTARAAVGGLVGAGTGALVQSGVNLARSKNAGPLYNQLRQLEGEQSALDNATYGIARDEGRQFQVNLDDARSAAMGQNQANAAELSRARLAAALENSDRQAAREWNATLQTAPQPAPTVREALDARRSTMGEVARRSDPQRGSRFNEPSPAPTRGPVEQGRSDRALFGAGQPGEAGTARVDVPSPRPGVQPQTATPNRGATAMQQTARERLDRQAAERAVGPELRPGPGLGAEGVKPVPVPSTVQDIGRTPVPIPQNPEAVRAALNHRHVRPFVDRIKDSAEWQNGPQDDATLLMNAYKHMSSAQRTVAGQIERGDDYLAMPEMTADNLAEAKKVVMEGARSVSPSFPDAVVLHATTAGEIDATKAGYDATRRMLGNANPAAKNVQQKSNEAFLASIPEMTPMEADLAANGVAAQVPMTMGFRANRTSGVGVIPSLSHAYRAGKFLRPLDVQAGNRGYKTLQDALIAEGMSASPKSTEDVTLPLETLSSVFRRKFKKDSTGTAP